MYLAKNCVQSVHDRSEFKGRGRRNEANVFLKTDVRFETRNKENTFAE